MWGVSWLGWGVLQFIGRTSRIERHFEPRAEELFRSGRPLIYALWHRFQLLPIYIHRNEDILVLVSRSRDGELVARPLRRMGFRTARGSSSRGGGAALLEVLGDLESGRRVVFTPDGPRGPLGAVQPGVVAAAQKTGVPVLPVAWAGRRVKALSSWDRFMIPYPFGRYQVVYHAPVDIAPEEAGGEEKIRRALDAAARLAEELLSEKTRPAGKTIC